MTTDDVRAVVLVGHCLPDRFMLKTAVRRAIPGAAVESVNDMATLETHLPGEPLLLVNRELDGTFPMPSGIELIRDLTGREPASKSLLVSNFDEAQDEAVAAGASARGFGKSHLYASETADILRDLAQK